MLSKKKEWLNTNMQSWKEKTPFISHEHKVADRQLHQEKPSHTFVAVRRGQARLPSVKDLVLPFMTQAIED